MKLKDCTSGEDKIGSYYGRYDFHFGPIREEKLRMLEIGVQSGNSIVMWEKYFPNAEIIGTDIDPACAHRKVERSKILIGDQADREFISQFAGMDIVIDDGGHTMNQQVVSFETLFPLLNAGGIYVVEDLHTSYWPAFKDYPVSFIDYLKGLTDEIQDYGRNSSRTNDPRSYVNRFGIDSIHIYESIAFIIKK